MEIIYVNLATDGTSQQSSLSHKAHSYSIYPMSFVADYSDLPNWELNV